MFVNIGGNNLAHSKHKHINEFLFQLRTCAIMLFMSASGPGRQLLVIEPKHTKYGKTLIMESKRITSLE